jgi:pyruvate kinase
MSRIRSDIPIYAFTRNEVTSNRVTLYRGVYPVSFDVVREPEVLYPAIFNKLIERNLCVEGDQIIVTKGEFSGVSGGTNSMKILTIRL